MIGGRVRETGSWNCTQRPWHGARVGDLAQLLEPDIKEAYGGLRDAVLLRALAASWTVEVPRTEWPAAVSTLLDV